MPIPAPEPYRRSNLTKQQKQEELQALYGVSMSKFTAEDIEKMRELIADHDAQNADAADFDPSKPPAQMYRFKKFPMMIYNHGKSHPAFDEERDILRGSLVVREMTHVKAHLASKVVGSQHELDAHLANGWSENPPEFRDESEIELGPALAAEAEEVSQAIRTRRPRRTVA